MRLEILDHGHRLRAKLFMGATAAMSRVDTPDIVRTLLYRPGFMTRPLLDLTAPAMRGPSFWTAGEREFLAMSIARTHECPFCVDTHAHLVGLASRGEIGLDRQRPEVLAIAKFLSERNQGRHADTDLPAEAVQQALRVNLVWGIVNRLANAFGFQLRPGQLETGTKNLHRFGYRFPAFLLAEGGRRTGDPIADLRYSVFEGPGVTDLTTRRTAATGDVWGGYAKTVRDASYRVTDADVEALREAGHSEDAIFEVTVAAATGAALRTFESTQD
ncbi:hypothetical protein [Actinocrispum sp. NPDC049592]|uniref:hypothetical protein n=1 Tax=Actinocrispum sp. NPDC049592 TaxID=3154835 RepID=UPI003439C280